VVFQSGNNQAKVSNVFQILLFAPFVTNPERNFWNFYVNKQFVLLSSLLLGTNTEFSITITEYWSSVTFIQDFSEKNLLHHSYFEDQEGEGRKTL
jgi:hypothetical protein